MRFALHNPGWFLATSLLLQVGCDEQPVPPAPSPSPPSDKAPVQEKVEARPWYEGSWIGSGILSPRPSALVADQAHRKDEEPPSPQGEDRKFEMSLEVAEDRKVIGTMNCEGKEARVIGLLDEEVLRLSVSGAQMQGTFVGKRSSGESADAYFSGTLQASLTEMDEVRAAMEPLLGAVELRRDK